MQSAQRTGWKTSEFWMLAVYSLISLALTGGWITQAQAHDLTLQAPALIADGGVALGMVSYILARSGLKLQWLTALGQQMTAQASQPAVASLAPINDGPASPSYAQPRTTTQPSTAQAPQPTGNSAAAPAGSGASL